jgi:SAM-dependent methyltransferase
LIQNFPLTPWSGKAPYTRFFLSIYDWFALECHCRLIWQCSASHIVEFYNQNVSGNHLDIGVGTGYFLDKCRFPHNNPRLALIDINPNSLVRAKKRLKRYQPSIHQINILEPISLNMHGFDSIGLSHVLHCLPGNMETKEIVFKNILPLLNPGGIVFGTTFLFHGTKRNLLATTTFWLANRLGFMSTQQDSLVGLTRSLKNILMKVTLTYVAVKLYSGHESNRSIKFQGSHDESEKAIIAGTICVPCGNCYWRYRLYVHRRLVIS